MMNFKVLFYLIFIGTIVSCKVKDSSPTTTEVTTVVVLDQYDLSGNWQHISSTVDNKKFMYNKGVLMSIDKNELIIINSKLDSCLYEMAFNQDTLVVRNVNLCESEFFGLDTVYAINAKNQRIKLYSKNNKILEFAKIE